MEDGAKLWDLVRRTGVLDVNSSYSYLMMCEYFKNTCVIAENDSEIVGFVTAFIPPEKPDTIFVWQVAVDSSMRGEGLGSKLLQELIKMESCNDVQFLEATISPSNRPSFSLFRKFARDLDTHCQVTELFPEDAFPNSDEQHEKEMLNRIGPF